MKKRYQETIKDMYDPKTLEQARCFFELLDLIKGTIYHKVFKLIFLNTYSITLEETAMLIGIGLTTLKKYIKECRIVLENIEKKEL